MAGLQLPRVVLRCIFVWKIFEDIFTLRIIITIIPLYTYFLRIFYVYLTPPPPEDLLLPMSTASRSKSNLSRATIDQRPADIDFVFFLFSLSFYNRNHYIFVQRRSYRTRRYTLLPPRDTPHCAKTRIIASERTDSWQLQLTS